MKYFFTICMVGLLFTYSLFAQEKNLTHKVEKGETINQIAQKYKVTPFDIYQLNPYAQSGLQPNSILLIPNTKIKPISNASSKLISKAKTYEVAPKETLFGIEKKYNVSDEALKKANPFLEKDGLQIGQILAIPSDNEVKILSSIPEKVIYHEVLPKETKYSIAKQYGITIEELEKQNPEIVSNLPIGYKLIIKGTAPKLEKIESQKVPSVPSFSEGNNKVEIATPVKKASNERKKVVLLLPFNMPKIQGDTINTTATRLKKDKFLNMTLDFYSGALVAIDSAKQLGINVDVTILDSQETKTTSNIVSLIKDNNLQNADAIVGPFYQANVEKTAELLSQNQVPVISPLSKDLGASFPNLYQTIPTVSIIRSTVFDFMRSKGGNIIAVVDKKKESIRKYIQENQKDVRFVPLTPIGGLLPESVKSLLVKNKLNYVVMETANTAMIKTTMTALLGSMPLYNVQLVILEPNETLDTDEIDFQALTKLKLMFPATNRENDAPEALIFEKEYKKKNKIFPSTFATRGFDVTFDTMMRLSQGNTYQETADSSVTEQVDNKFEYYKKETGGYANKGVYVLYYDTDLTTKVAN